ncbi:adenylyltransferase/cytidyltransferase family protein [Haemophilus haemoglobinophilus]|nr:adenylyltransferase/cytidyltransferase family protein [Canicola haemoglobinophilus]
MKKVITYGTFDMLHIGHINLLTRAKSRGDYLIVGVTSDDYDRSRGKLNVIQPENERLSAIRSLEFVDEVILETHKSQKEEDIQKYQIDEFIVGDDWVGKFDYLKAYTEVTYLARTQGISSTQLRNNNIKAINIGIVGINNDSKRFIEEASHVGLVKVTAVYDENISFLNNDFIKEIPNKYTVYDKFISSGIDAVYVCSELDKRYEYIIKAFERSLHVLCENPFSTDGNEVEELFKIAENKKLILLLALKTAFMPAFNKFLDEINKGIIGEIKDVRATFTSLYKERGFSKEYLEYGATNLLMSYPSLIIQKLAGVHNAITFFDQKNKDGYDISNLAISQHINGVLGVASVGSEIKSDGNAIVSGSKGYALIPAPWWLTKEFYFKFEDSHKELKYEYEFEGNGFRYMISEFASLIRRESLESAKLSINDMKEISKIIVKYNEVK